jgi:hypothetical protein
MQPDPTLVATCSDSSCALVDLLALPLTECQSNADCRIRTQDCCECGGSLDFNSLIAIRTDSELAYVRLVCDPGQGCDACLPTYPEQASAECHANRCVVTGTPATTPQ